VPRSYTRFGQDRSILLRIHPLEWSRIDADQSESAVQTQSKADMSGLRDFTYGQFLNLNAASAAASFMLLRRCGDQLQGSVRWRSRLEQEWKIRPCVRASFGALLAVKTRAPRRFGQNCSLFQMYVARSKSPALTQINLLFAEGRIGCALPRPGAAQNCRRSVFMWSAWLILIENGCALHDRLTPTYPKV